jgi:hypothetical protein
MKSIEIPFAKDRGARYRFFEMLPGILAWGVLALPFVLAIFVPILSVIFIIAYLLLWFFKAVGLNIRSIQGYKQITLQQKLPWNEMLKDMETGVVGNHAMAVPGWHLSNVVRLQEKPTPITPDNIVHAIIIATYNESKEVLIPTIESVINSDYDMKNVILVIAHEERGGKAVAEQTRQLIKDYKHHFKHAMAVEHPDGIEGEVKGKGGNITFAGRELTKYILKKKIDPLHVVVTTLDSDNRPHKQYLPALSYLYSVTPEPKYVSYQPIPMYTSNIWDVPAPMRVIATGNSFWNIVLSMRPHMIRNFASHAQSLQTLIDTDYWSVRTIVEDGHQFWRTYFRYNGKHDVYPLYVPIYQDAVLSDTYRKTLKAQFSQIQRWAYGASDIAYVAEQGFLRGAKMPKFDLIAKFSRLVEGHVSWAVAPLLLTFSGFIPRFINSSDLGFIGFTTYQLPNIIVVIQRIALLGIVTTLFLSMKMLPPKPERYKHHRTVFMVLQWVLLPITTLVYNSLSALYSQTRLIFGRYMENFVVTDKIVVEHPKEV